MASSGPERPRAASDQRRGRHKVFLGMAAGVGKTYRMLQEGRAEREEGRDVVIGYLETHGREETAAEAEGLELVPQRKVSYRDTALEEMDLPAILARAPELALIDEIAHTNAAGVEHAKRFEDVADVLAKGIDVFSTVNVQHLESLNDQVAELTGVRVRETMPDSVLGDADEVVLIDLTPEALLDRLRAGKVYPGETRTEAALQNFFKIENLAALREVALRQVAQEVESKRLVRETVGSREDRLVGSASTQAVGERLLALVKPGPRGQRIVRRAWRSAQRLGADLDLLYVRRPREAGEDELRELDALRRLASVTGARLIVEEDDDVVAVAKRVAADRGTTYVLIGAPSRRGLLSRLAEPLPVRLVKELPGLDVRIVADRALIENGEQAGSR
jgi:two-component system, OmpR family, sensor histidine kinase KdpD